MNSKLIAAIAQAFPTSTEVEVYLPTMTERHKSSHGATRVVYHYAAAPNFTVRRPTT